MTPTHGDPSENSASHPRPGMAGMRRAHLEIEDIHRLMTGVPPVSLPLVALTSVWLWNLAQDGAAAAQCVDGCLTLHHALAEYGISSRVEAVAVRVQGGGSDTTYGQHPRYNADGTFNGHTVLVIPDAGRFIDPTIQQFAEIPHSQQAMVPLQALLPAPDGLGDHPISIDRGDHMVVYLPVTAQLRQAWHSPSVDSRGADYRKAGANLAANALAMLQLDDMRGRAEQSPYPRLRHLLSALNDASPVADSDGFRFADPLTGMEMRLDDVP